MKLQMHNDSVRVRIDEAELAALQAGERLSLRVGNVSPLFALQVVLGDALSLQLGTRWRLVLPRAEIGRYVQTLPNRHALELPLPNAGSALMLQFEVDVRDSLQVRGAHRRGQADHAKPE